ncbi:MAG: LacI family DNA-binding transcriptional regulator [Chloroflexota bacterium]
MAVTLRDISKKVGKSVTTVSRALHGYNDVSPETKAMVRRLADELGYTPNILAQRLQKQRTDTIGFVLPTFGPRFSDPYFSEILAGIGNQAAEMGYDLLVSTQPPGEQELDAYKKLVEGRRVDGFIIVRTRCKDARIEYLCKAEFPFVAFGRTQSPCNFPYVDEDSEIGMRLMVDHLAERGFERFSYLAAPENLMFAEFRLKGFLDGLSANNLPQDDHLIVIGDLTQNGGYAQANILLDLPEPPDAIVASNDLMAIGAISAAQEKGLRVGQDIAITGFDDTPMAEHSHPPLTTVHQPVYKIGRMVCEMLIKRIQGEFLEEEQIILMPSLVIRQSCGGQLVETP